MQLPSFGSNLQFIWQCFHCWRNRYTWTRLEISRIQHWPAEKAGIYSRAELPHFVWKLKLFRRALGTHAPGSWRPTLGLLEPSSHPTYLCHFSCGSSKQISSELKFSLNSPRLQCLSFESVWDTELGRKKKKRHLCLEGGNTKLSMSFQAEMQCPVAVASTWGSFQALMKSSSPSEQKTLKTNKQILDNLKVAFPMLSPLVILIASSEMLGFSFSPGTMWQWSDSASFLRSGVENVICECSETRTITWSGLKWSFFPYIILETVESSVFCSI